MRLKIEWTETFDYSTEVEVDETTAEGMQGGVLGDEEIFDLLDQLKVESESWDREITDITPVGEDEVREGDDQA